MPKREEEFQMQTPGPHTAELQRSSMAGVATQDCKFNTAIVIWQIVTIRPLLMRLKRYYTTEKPRRGVRPRLSRDVPAAFKYQSVVYQREVIVVALWILENVFLSFWCTCSEEPISPQRLQWQNDNIHWPPVELRFAVMYVWIQYARELGGVN
ncbi:Protein of unknown function [Gryllus bimaculatus]|nr:Protein of unknown function [Gryllus bimaculatus]